MYIELEIRCVERGICPIATLYSLTAAFQRLTLLLSLWRHATASTRKQNDRQKIRHAWTCPFTMGAFTAIYVVSAPTGVLHCFGFNCDFCLCIFLL